MRRSVTASAKRVAVRTRRLFRESLVRASFDVIVVGGGLYGAYAAATLARENPTLRFMLIEAAPDLLTGASATNQGHLHRGYMYAGMPELGRECALAAPDFASEFAEAVDHDVTLGFGIHGDSKISVSEYERYCGSLGLPLRAYGGPALGAGIARAYMTSEKTFNAAKLRTVLAERLANAGVVRLVGQPVDRVRRVGGRYVAELKEGSSVDAPVVINATFADINTLHERSGLPLLPLQHDRLLHYIIRLPSEYRCFGITIGVGPYVSLMPSSLRDGHVLADGAIQHLPPTPEALTADHIEARFHRTLAYATGMLPFLADAQLTAHTLGTRARPGDGSHVQVLSDYAGWSNYHLLLGGKMGCVSTAIPPLRQALARRFGRDRRAG